MTQLTLNEQEKRFVQNLLLSRQRFWEKFSSQGKNVDEECKYPDVETLTALEYRQMVNKNGVAERALEVEPLESWKVLPTVYEEEDSDATTPFEIAWESLNKRLQGEAQWYRGNNNSGAIWEYLIRADILSGVGRFGIILIGLDDGKKLSEEVEKPSKDKLHQLIYLRPLDETMVRISAYDTDEGSARYGQPTEYTVTLTQFANGFISTTDTKVHWNRVFHIVDNRGSSDLFSNPRLKSIYHRLLDIHKLYGGGAEMYWRGAFPGLSFETHPQLGGDVNLDVEGMKDQMVSYMEGLQRYLVTSGMSAKSLAPQVVSAKEQIDLAIQAICIKLACPKRIFEGSERGELASSQDKETWEDRMKSRQERYISPNLISPFVGRLISLGVLPEPEHFYIDWPNISEMSALESAQVANTHIDTLSKFLSGGVAAILTPMDLYHRFFNMGIEEAESIVDAAMEDYRNLQPEGNEEDDEQTQTEEA